MLVFSSIVNLLFSPQEIGILFGLLGGTIFLVAAISVTTARAAAKACTPENGKKLAIGAGKIAGKAAGKYAWHVFRKRIGM